MGDDSLNQYGIYFRLDLPSGYKLSPDDTIIAYNDLLTAADGSHYTDTTLMEVNPRGAQQVNNGVTYNSYMRNADGDDYYGSIGTAKYKITIVKE